MTDEPTWYRQSLYEQSWENYRNEDDNYRSTVTQYLVFMASIIYAASQAKSVTVIIGIVGLLLSVVTAFYLGRVTRYSRRWLIAKDEALGKALAEQELNHLKKASKTAWMLRLFSVMPGYCLTFAIPIGGAVLFVLMICKGSQFWGH